MAIGLSPGDLVRTDWSCHLRPSGSHGWKDDKPAPVNTLGIVTAKLQDDTLYILTPSLIGWTTHVGKYAWMTA
jgi:hypothetical protein